MAQMVFALTRDAFALHSDDNLACWALMRADCSLGFGQAGMDRADPLIEAIAPGLQLPIRLTAQETMRQSARVRRVWYSLVEDLRGIVRA